LHCCNPRAGFHVRAEIGSRHGRGIEENGDAGVGIFLGSSLQDANLDLLAPVTLSTAPIQAVADLATIIPPGGFEATEKFDELEREKNSANE
jgi:hypothetical protein